MHRILFICLGNICRSPMAQCIMTHLVAQRGLSQDFYIDSAATSNDECGNPIYPPARRKLQQMGIPLCEHRARQITAAEYTEFDSILCAESSVLQQTKRIFGGDPDRKVKLFLDFTDHPRNLPDPWYTGDFDTTYDAILDGCTALLNALT